MSSVGEELKAYDMTIKEADDDDRERVDFTVEENGDMVAWACGDDTNDVDFECDHPYMCVEFGDEIEDQGECLLCGAYCDWHYEDDGEGHGIPEPHEWYNPRDVGGFMKEYIDEQEARNGE